MALHRAVHLARANADARVLLTTFSDTLASALRPKLRALIANQPHLGERIDVYAIDAIGRRLYELNFGPVHLALPAVVRELLQRAGEGAKFSPRFLLTEWEIRGPLQRCLDRQCEEPAARHRRSVDRHRGGTRNSDTVAQSHANST